MGLKSDISHWLFVFCAKISFMIYNLSTVFATYVSSCMDFKAFLFNSMLFTTGTL